MLHDEAKDLLPLLVMLEAIGKIEIYSTGFQTAVDFFQKNDQAMFNASLLLLMNIGEQGNKLSDDLRSRHPTFPFNKIRGLRNRIAHDYVGIDYEMVFDIVNSDISAIKSALVLLIQHEISQGTFDLGEFNAARQSPFYKHIEFEMLMR